MLKIRLQRTGRKNMAQYRIVVCEHTSPIKGKFHEKVGIYNPITKECSYNEERIKHWISVGAKPSDAVQNLLDKGGKIKQRKRKRIGEKQKAREEALKKAKEEEMKAKEEAKNTEGTPKEDTENNSTEDTSNETQKQESDNKEEKTEDKEGPKE